MFKNFQNIFSRALQHSYRAAQTRTTFILRRRYEPRLNKMNALQPRKLKRRDHYYLLVEDANCRKQEELELILLKNVKSVGNAGDIIKGKSVLSYELYLLTGAATFATPENIKKYSHLKKKDETPIQIKNLLRDLKETHVPVFMHEFNPWTIEPWHVRLALRKLGIMCDLNCIKLPKKPISGPNFDIEKKDFLIHIIVNNQYSVPMRCRLFHLTFAESNFNISFDSKFYLEKVNPIFPEEREVLEQIPIPEEKQQYGVIFE